MTTDVRRVSQKTSALLIDFANAKHFGSKRGSKLPPNRQSPRIFVFYSRSYLQCYQGTPVFIARAVQQGSAVPLPLGVGRVPAVPPSPHIYTLRHPDRVKNFPFKGRILVEEASPDSINRQWGHELDHDAEFTGLCLRNLYNPQKNLSACLPGQC